MSVPEVPATVAEIRLYADGACLEVAVDINRWADALEAAERRAKKFETALRVIAWGDLFESATNYAKSMLSDAAYQTSQSEGESDGN